MDELLNEPTWENQLKFAHNKPTKELFQHALVSTSNHHRCSDCYCCAALSVLEFRHPHLETDDFDKQTEMIEELSGQ